MFYSSIADKGTISSNSIIGSGSRPNHLWKSFLQWTFANFFLNVKIHFSSWFSSWPTTKIFQPLKFRNSAYQSTMTDKPFVMSHNLWLIIQNEMNLFWTTFEVRDELVSITSDGWILSFSCIHNPALGLER